jgi:hypothetical protein
VSFYIWRQASITGATIAETATRLGRRIASLSLGPPPAEPGAKRDRPVTPEVVVRMLSDLESRVGAMHALDNFALPDGYRVELVERR